MTGSTILFLLFFVLTITDGIFDMSFFYPALALMIVLLDIVIYKRDTVFIRNPLMGGLALKNWILYLIYNCFITFFSAIVFRSKYVAQGIPILINPILITCIVMYFSYYIDWNTFFMYLRNIGIVISSFGVIETVTRRALFPTLAQWQKSVLLQNGTQFFRSYTVFTHPIVNGSFLVTYLTLLHYYPLKSRYINFFMKLMCVYGVIGTGSRSCWIALFVVIVMDLIDYLFVSKKEIYRYYVASAGVMLVLAALVLYFFREQYIDILRIAISKMISAVTIGSKDLSKIHRFGMAKSAIQYLMKDWECLLFGRGDFYGIEFARNHALNDSWAIIDNQYITMLLNSGVVGMLMFLSTILVPVRSFVKKSLVVTRIAVTVILAYAIEFYFFEGVQWKICCYIYTCMIFAFSYSENMHMDDGINNNNGEKIIENNC